MLSRNRLDHNVKFQLHLGCYNLPVDGWVNTDISRQILLSKVPFGPQLARRVGLLSDEKYADHESGAWRRVRYLDLSKRFPFPDSSVNAIYSSHVLEHLTSPIVNNMLSESLRILRPNGTFRVVVPDLDLVVMDYNHTDPDATMKRIFEVQRNDKDRHWWMYNAHSLEVLLRGAGFSSVQRRSFQTGTCPDLHLLDNRPDVSLYMEAYKYGPPVE